MDRILMEQLMDQARVEIGELERTLEALNVRRDALARFINESQNIIRFSEQATPNPLLGGGMLQARAILQQPQSFTGTQVAALALPNASSVELSTSRFWEGIQLVMQMEMRPATVTEIVSMLDKHKIIIKGDHPREYVRSCIIRKDEVFEKVGRGLYALKAWPDRVKQLRNDEQISAEATWEVTEDRDRPKALP